MEEDPVIAEIPVLNTKALERFLHVFCWPLRTTERPYEVADINLEVADALPTPNSSAASNNNQNQNQQSSPRNNNQQQQQRSNNNNNNSQEDVLLGNKPKFSMNMRFDVSGAAAAGSFQGKEPTLHNVHQQPQNQQQQQQNQSRRTKNEFASSSSSNTTSKNNHNTNNTNNMTGDDPFGDLNDQNQNNNNNNNQNTNNQQHESYEYQLDSTPQPQHCSYAACVFYQGACHITRISGVHQFYPRTKLDQSLDLSLEGLSDAERFPDSNNNANNNRQQQQQQQQQQGATQTNPYYRQPRSVALARTQDRARELDFIHSNHPDAVPISQRLLYSGPEIPPPISPTITTRSTSSSSSSSFGVKPEVKQEVKQEVKNLPGTLGFVSLENNDEDEDESDNNKHSSALSVSSLSRRIPYAKNMTTPENIRTAAMVLSSSDPGRDEDEMMWALQGFFPFVDGASIIDGSSGALAELRRRSAAGTVAFSSASAGSIALKFAQHAMGIDEQIGCVLAAAKAVTVTDLQKTVLTPDQNAVSAHRIVEALRRMSVCIHGIWASLWDSSCSGGAGFVREYIMYCFATQADATLSARQVLEPFNGNTIMRKTARNILAMFADLNQDTRTWTLKGYEKDHFHVKELQKNGCGNEVNEQLEAWRRRRELIMSNMRLLTQGDTVGRNQLALRSVATAGYAAIRAAAAAQATAAASASGGGQRQNQQQHQQQNLQAIEDVARCRRFVRNAFELHGVINKGLFRERLMSMARTRESIIFAAPKETLQDALKQELMPFTESSWILKTPGDVTTVALRPYFIAAMLEKQTFTTKEIEHAALQLILNDPAQNILPRPGGASSGSGRSTTPDREVPTVKQEVKKEVKQEVKKEVKQEVKQEDAAPAPATATATTTKKGGGGGSGATPGISQEMHQTAVRIINELATFNRTEKMWRVKSGIVQFVAIS